MTDIADINPDVGRGHMLVWVAGTSGVSVVGVSGDSSVTPVLQSRA